MQFVSRARNFAQNSIPVLCCAQHNYCFFVIGHDRRKILHFNVTRNPNALWVVQHLREAWAYKQPHRFLLFGRDAKFGADVVSAVRDMGSEPTRTDFRSPWQNAVAERWWEVADATCWTT
jgi:transposase InsO family protein